MTIEHINCTIERLDSLIAPEDVLFCQQAYGAYNDMLSLLQDTLQQFRYNQDKTHDYLANDDSGLIKAVVWQVDKTMNYLEADITNLTKQFIEHVEIYFEKGYNLYFTPHKIIGKSPLTIEHYSYVLQNIMAQCGEDLKAASKNNTIKRFRHYFKFQRNKPKLSNTKVSLPEILFHDGRLTDLFYALSLYLYGTTKISDEMKEFKSKWHRQNQKVENRITDSVSLKAYSNNKADLLFKSAELASGFYAFYDLANPPADE